MGAARAGVRAREVEKSGSGLEFILSQIFFFVIWAVLLMLAKTA